MSVRVKDVHPQEVADLLREARRLRHLGESASYEDWLAFHERKAELLHRVAANPGPLVDPVEAKEVADEASAQVESMLRHPSVMGGMSR